MELTQVRYFIALCGTLNFTRAAAQCNVTQPAFTRAIQRLEQEFGGALLFRERNLTQLTELGRTIRPHLETMLEAADAAHAASAARLSRGAASLKLGLGPGIGVASIADAIREVALMLPDVSLRFDESGPAALVEAMLADQLDCALLPDDCDLPERLNRWPLYSDRAATVLPPAHRLLAQNTVTGADLAEEIILVGAYCGGFGNRLAESSHSRFRLQRCNGATIELLDLVVAGLGVALLSDRMTLPPPLAVRRFTDPDLTRRILLTTVAGRPLNPAAASFVKLCRAKAFG